MSISGIRFDGMASGLDTTNLVEALMSVERLPVAQMESKIAADQARADGLRALNSQVAALATAAKEMSSPEAFQPTTGSASIPGVTVTVADGSKSSALNFTVDSVAARHAGVSAAMTNWAGGTLDITNASGVATSFSGSSLDELVSNINKDLDLGISATLVKAGNDVDGNQQYRLQLIGNDTGADSVFTATKDGTSLFSNGGAVTSMGSDAKLTLFPGSAAEQVVTSSTNEFDDLATGLSITISAEAVGKEASVTAATDLDAATEAGKKLMEQINHLVNTFKTATAVNGAGSDASGSIFTGDFTVRNASTQIFNSVVRTGDGTSQAWLGIEPDQFGAITVDMDKMRQALETDPARASAALASLATRVADAASTISDKYDGSFTKSIESRETEIRRTEDSITNLERRLAMREESIRAQFTAMEIALTKMQDVQAYLGNQISAWNKSND